MADSRQAHPRPWPLGRLQLIQEGGSISRLSDMSDRSADLDYQSERFERKLPDKAARLARWLRRPSSRWVRIPAALLLIAGGFIGFLPILGFWMIPLGLLLIAQDVPFLRPPMARALNWLQDKWEAYQARRKS